MADGSVGPEAQAAVAADSQHGVVARLHIVLVQAQHLLQLLHTSGGLLRPQDQLLEVFHCKQQRSMVNTQSLGPLLAGRSWPQRQQLQLKGDDSHGCCRMMMPLFRRKEAAFKK